MGNTRRSVISATRFVWHWPPRLRVDGAEPVTGRALQLRNGLRLFVPKEDEGWHRIPFYGCMLMVRDSWIPAEHASLFLAMVTISMCYLAGRRPCGVRRAMAGLWGSYRESASAAESLLGKREEAWQRLFPKGTTTKGYQPPRFRNQLGKFLAQLGGGPRSADLPIGIDALFTLAKEKEPDYNTRLLPIFRGVGDPMAA